MSTTVPMPHLTGTRGRIVAAYKEALKATGAAGPAAAPHITLRDSLKSAASLPPEVVQAFGELTALAEAALYSDREPGEGMATQAEALAARIRQG